MLVDKNRCAKVSDFGIATGRSSSRDEASFQGHENEQHTFGAGTLRFMAPEVLNAGTPLATPLATHTRSGTTTAVYDERADVYSFGLLLWEVAHVRVPWANVEGRQVAFVLAPSGQRPPLTPDSSPSLATVYEPLAHLIASCWHKDPAERPSMAACAEDLGRLLQLYVAHADSSSAGPTQPQAQLLACDELGVAIPPIDGTTESRHLTTREMSETSTIDGAGMAASDAVNSNTAKHSGSAVFTI